jgi:F-type H+-transporting ATPase subunit gamma
MRATLCEVAASGADATHPLFEQREEKQTLEIVIVTSDRGLAGAFNANVIKAAEATIAARSKEFQGLSLTIVGKKASDYFKRRRASEISAARPVGPQVTFLEAQEIARRLMARFESGEADEVVMIYSEFVSTMTQKPIVVPLLPFAPVSSETGDEQALPYEIEPDARKLLAVLVPKAVEVEVFRALLENQAGEHAARMTAMENATKNTEELIDSLTLEFNRARQAAITSELVEIISGAQALE